MAPAALLISGPVQSLCPSCSAARKWQPKRSISSGSALTRPSTHRNMDKASVKSSISFRSLNSVFGRRRRSGLGPETGTCSSRRVFTASVEGSIAVEETETSASGDASEGSDENAESVPAAATPPPVKAERFKPRIPGQKARREDPTVPAEALVEGAVFTGNVTTIQPFGAFVNFGAFTDGLVHISKMSTGYVSNVSDIVKLGQEVTVTILNVEQTSGRIALSMVGKEEKEAAAKTGDKEGSDKSRFQQGSDGRPVNRGRIAGGGRQNRRDEPQKPPTKLVKGQEVEGTVKNKIRSGVFVELPENEEGFLRYSDIPGGENMAPEASLQAGEKIKATVLKIDRGKVVLTMKPSVDIGSVNREINKGKDSAATNPFEAAFRAFNLIPAEPASLVEEDVTENEAIPEATTAEEEVIPEAAAAEEEVIPEAAAAVEEVVPETAAAVEEVVPEAAAPEEEVISEATAAVEEVIPEAAAAEEEVIPEAAAAEVEVIPEAAAADKVVSEVAAAVEEVVPETAPVVEEVKADVAVEVGEAPVAEEPDIPEAVAPAAEEAIPEAAAVVEDVADVTIPVGESPVAEENFAIPEPVVAAIGEVTAEAASVVQEVVADVTAAVGESLVAEEKDVPEAVATDLEAPLVEEDVVAEAPASAEDIVSEATVALTEEISAVEEAPVAEEEVAEEAIPKVAAVVENSPEVVQEEASAEEQSVPVAAALVVKEEVDPEAAAVPPVQEAPAVEKKQAGVSAAIVKQLRDETGAGMMDCKRALADTGGDIEKARENLRKKGLASAEKKASRIASEGLIGSYIHDSRIGVLLEVNCETDFVSRGAAFKNLVEDLGMQVVASQQVQYVSVEDVPAEVVNKEKELEAQREDLINKPEAIRARIVDGRVSKRLNEFALLEQPYIRDDKILVKDVVKQTVATLGENIKVRRFERYVLGEGLQKKGTDFAAEVAAQTAVKAPAEVPKAVEAPKEEAAPAAALDTDKVVVVSAALVKELRDQTGAGMMDCKKALASTENNLEKAVEFLRKKGLASADKKASRLASEGLIGTYIHDGRIGILIEVNCETDFVARGERFKELVEDLAMQIAAYPQVEVVSVEDVPAEVVAKEKELESGKEDLASKPEAIRARIVDGRVSKRLAELALLEQPFIKDDKKLVKDVVKEAIASLGENIQVRRFTRFNLGEGIEKKVVDFASEVAAQSGMKA